MTIFLSSCGVFKNIGGTKDDGKITITFLQINDMKSPLWKMAK
jgi:hypothetical protein